MKSSELVVKTEDQALDRVFQELRVSPKNLLDMLTVLQQHRILCHPLYLQENSQPKIVEDRSFSLLKYLDAKDTFRSESTPSTAFYHYDFPINEKRHVENQRSKFEAGAEEETGYCSLDEENTSIGYFSENPEVYETSLLVKSLDDHNQNVNGFPPSIEDEDSRDDNYEEDEECDSDNENENEIGNNAIDCFVILQCFSPGLISQKFHRVARITDEKLIDDEVQFTVNFYEKHVQNDDRFLPCVSNLQTNINIAESDIRVWLGAPTMDSDDGLKFPFDFTNYKIHG